MEKVQLCEKLPCGCHPLLYALISSELTRDDADNGDLLGAGMQGLLTKYRARLHESYSATLFRTRRLAGQCRPLRLVALDARSGVDEHGIYKSAHRRWADWRDRNGKFQRDEEASLQIACRTSHVLACFE